MKAPPQGRGTVWWVSAAIPGLCYNSNGMDEQTSRIVILTALNGLFALLVQQAKTKLTAAREKRGCSLAYALGKRLGQVWAARNNRC